MIHRDLKPANILLKWEDGTWIPKIADFGVAKVMHEERLHQTRTGVGLGTPMYMAPEQTRDASRVDRRADVFAMGSILYEMLAHHRAFEGTDLVELYSNIRNGAYPPLPPEVPARMRAAVDQALEPDPDQRLQTIDAMLEVWCGTLSLPADVQWDAPDIHPVRVESTHDSSAVSHSQTWDPSDAPPPADSFPTLTPEAASTLLPELQPVPAPATSTPRWRWLLAGSALIVAAIGAWFWPGSPEPVFGEGAVPVLYEADAQDRLERSWTALLDADFTDAERFATTLTRNHPEAAEGWAVLAMARAAQGQGGPAHQAMWKAVEQAEHQQGPQAEALRTQGRARRKGWDRALPAMQALTQEHPDDLLVAWVASWSLPADHAQFAAQNADRMLVAAPDHPYPFVFAVTAALATGDRDRAKVLVQNGLQRFPDHPAILVLSGEVAVAQRELNKARTDLMAALRFAPGLYAARHRLAEVSLLLGNEDQTRQLITASMAPSEPAGQRAAFTYRIGLTYAGLGRLREAEQRFRAGAESAAADNDRLTQGWLLGMIPLIDLDADRFDRATATTKELLSFAATTPEIPEGERASMSRALLEARAFIAARRGDVAQAETLLERMRALPGIRESSIEWVERDLASHRGDLAALDGLFVHAQPGCLGRWERARAEALAGAKKPALDKLRTLLDESVCGPVGAERWANALAFALAAELATEPNERRRFLAGFHRLWPNPDADLPVVQRMAALER